VNEHKNGNDGREYADGLHGNDREQERRHRQNRGQARYYTHDCREQSATGKIVWPFVEFR
jgi:hypothetical protein